MPRSPAAIQAELDQLLAQPGSTDAEASFVRTQRIQQLRTELASANQAQLASGDRAGVRAREARAAASDGQTLAGQSADVRADLPRHPRLPRRRAVGHRPRIGPSRGQQWQWTA